MKQGETSSGSHGKLQSPALTTSSAENIQRPMQCVVTQWQYHRRLASFFSSCIADLARGMVGQLSKKRVNLKSFAGGFSPAWKAEQTKNQKTNTTQTSGTGGTTAEFFFRTKLRASLQPWQSLNCAIVIVRQWDQKSQRQKKDQKQRNSPNTNNNHSQSLTNRSEKMKQAQALTANCPALTTSSSGIVKGQCNED